MNDVHAVVDIFDNPEEMNEDCQHCCAVTAIGNFNVGDVETPLCAGCSTYRNEDNSEVVFPET
ncbi:hypothetical protein [Rhodococcus qingshengii]|uniref:hypothetical protein n=1 Tax=Rhodococcus qingshengii TaxID=334542 RepID=UPI0035DFE75E